MTSFRLLEQIPAGAFGDGSHPTTLLCARAVDFLCRQHRPAAVLDVGTGTGILARTARARGASFVVATDIDPVALKSAQANSLLDGDATTPIVIADHAPDHWGAHFDLVVANILEAPLLELAPSLSRALKPNGRLLLSGFTRLQVPQLRTAFEAENLIFESCAYLDEWALLSFNSLVHSL